MFAYLGALVKGFNKEYRNLFYDSGLEAVLAKAAHGCAAAAGPPGFSAAGLREPIAVLEQKNTFETGGMAWRNPACRAKGTAGMRQRCGSP